MPLVPATAPVASLVLRRLSLTLLAASCLAAVPAASSADQLVYSNLATPTGGVHTASGTRLWDDLNLVGGGTLSEISWYAYNSASGAARSFTGSIELRAFPNLSAPPSSGALLGTIADINPGGVSLAAAQSSLITLSNLAPLNINLAPNSRVGVGLRYDQHNFGIRYYNPPAIGSSGSNYWFGDTASTSSSYGGNFGWQLKTLTGPTTTVTSTPFVDAEGESTNGTAYTLKHGANFIEAYESPTSYSRGLMEFNLATIPTTATVTSAKLDLDITGYVTGSSNSQLDVYGYVGNGAMEGSDALQTATLLADNVNVSTGGVLSIDLNPALLESLVDGGDWLGLTVVGAKQYFQVTFASSEYHALISSITAPTLRVEYVPEPATLALLALGGAAGVMRRR